jgi:hypothetical protein
LAEGGEAAVDAGEAVHDEQVVAVAAELFEGGADGHFVDNGCGLATIVRTVYVGGMGGFPRKSSIATKNIAEKTMAATKHNMKMCSLASFS